uniref:Uncharacterized protein n=1 Tax=Hucho hucho TaxID=62062 RepID=A0A4W5L6F8_9TELE
TADDIRRHGSTIKNRIKNLLRSPSVKLRNNRKGNIDDKDLGSRETLKVLGITASDNSGLACDPLSGLVAYSSGHLPAVCVWEVCEQQQQVAELQEHRYGMSCVAFSPNSKYIVSVGYEHDMMVHIWAWKVRQTVIAANKVSSKVQAVLFSEDSSYFVTARNRHVKFWYLDHSKSNKASAPVPLLRRSGLLGELRNNLFCDVACGRGSKADSTFCITFAGLLCELNSKRMLDQWVGLWTSVARSLCVSEELVFCGCADGMVQAFSPADLGFICTLPRPH